MKIFRKFLLEKYPELEQATQKLNTEWLTELSTTSVIPKDIYYLCKTHFQIKTGLTGGIFLFSAHHFSPRESTLVAAACLELLQTIFHILKHPENRLHKIVSQTFAEQGHANHHIKATEIITHLSNHLISWLHHRVNTISQKTGNQLLPLIFLNYLKQTQQYYCQQSFKINFSFDTATIKHNYISKTAATFCLPLVLGYRLNRRNRRLKPELLLELLGENLGIIWQSQQDCLGFTNNTQALSVVRHQITQPEPCLWLITLLNLLPKPDALLVQKICQTKIVTETDLYYLHHLYQKYECQKALTQAISHEYRLSQRLISDLFPDQNQANSWQTLLSFVAQTKVA